MATELRSRGPGGAGLESSMRQNQGQDNPHIREALRYIAMNGTQRLTLRRVAKEVGISPNYFSTLFHKTVGIGFRAYLCRVKVEGSKQLLLDTDDSLVEIAAAMGFPDQSNFSKVFKRVTGVSPGKYRVAQSEILPSGEPPKK